MAAAILTINSRNYGAWSLRGWLLCRFAGLDFEVAVVDASDPESRAELLLLSPSFRVPALRHEGLLIWDTLAIAEYLNERYPRKGLYPESPELRALCRSVAGEVHSGFSNLRSALPMNLKVTHHDFPAWEGARPDIDRLETVWAACFEKSGGPLLFGSAPTVADAMYAPECTRLVTYGVKLGAAASAYVAQMMSLPEMQEWVSDAQCEPDDSLEFDFEF